MSSFRGITAAFLVVGGLMAPATATGQPLVQGTLARDRGRPVQGAVALEVWPVGPMPKRDETPRSPRPWRES